jgi:hypothetical protein
MRLPALLATLPGRVLGKLGVSPRSRSAFASFRSYLAELVSFAQPRNTLEFGPGASSRIILRHSRSKLISLATDAGQYQRARRSIRDERFDLRYAPEPGALAQLTGRRFDLIFVDAGDRVQNLLGARGLLEEDGILVLHDAHRPDYLPGVRCYAHGYFVEHHSLLLFKSRSRFHEVRAHFPADVGCHCKYCGTPERSEYRRSVAAELGRE